MFPESPTKASDPSSGDFVCQLIDLQPQLRSFVGHLMPFPDARADIVQEVNMLLWEKREDFEEGTNFRTWAYTFARFVTMNHQKRARREKRLVFNDELLESLADEFEESDPLIAERMPALKSCLGKVPADERHLLLERYAEHGAVERESRDSGRSAAALRGMLFRLRIALRRCIEREMKINPAPGS
ncbi:sigma-70 family RNA polymerase sigma factor [Luteolibacter marinus]|uniref:sigma-70 family RNA polymerase sigma factor n=1 Tax=Luteolibacter marinus TaxID=2776705 RepID=UPI0031BB052E